MVASYIGPYSRGIKKPAPHMPKELGILPRGSRFVKTLLKNGVSDGLLIQRLQKKLLNGFHIVKAPVKK